MRFVAVDVETTGLSPRSDRIVEFCFARLTTDLRIMDEWVDRVNPGTLIPREAAAVHGITQADVEKKPGFDRYAPGVQDFLADTGVVAYNAAFDLRFLHHALQRHGFPGFTEPVPVVDPLHVFKTWFDTSYTLEEAYEAVHGCCHAEAHSARGDVAATVSVLRRQAEELGVNVQDLAVSFTPQ